MLNTIKHRFLIAKAVQKVATPFRTLVPKPSFIHKDVKYRIYKQCRKAIIKLASGPAAAVSAIPFLYLYNMTDLPRQVLPNRSLSKSSTTYRQGQGVQADLKSIFPHVRVSGHQVLSIPNRVCKFVSVNAISVIGTLIIMFIKLKPTIYFFLLKYR